MQTQSSWKELLRDSRWITIAWEWLQTLLGRAVDFVLWVTMIFTSYQLIPGVPQPPIQLSAFMFVLQFVALDIGGMGLNRLAQQQGLAQWAYARIVAYILIAITLVTITYAGVEHAFPTISPQVTAGIEVVLVVARSIMTVLYGQAIHSLKVVEHTAQNRIAALDREVSSLRVQLDREQQRVSSLRVQLDSKEQEVSSVQSRMDKEVSTVRVQLDSAITEIETLRVQLESKEHQLDSLKETLGSGMKWHESNAQQIVAGVRSQLESEQQRVSTLQAQLVREQQEVSKVRVHLSSVQAQLDSKDKEVSSLRVQLDSAEQGKVDRSRQGREQGQVIHLDTNRIRKGGQDAAEQATGEQIRILLQAEPGLSGRAIAARVGCSPTTAAKWKGIVEKEVATEKEQVI